MPHLCARFGPGGQLIKVIPNLPSEGQPALVEIHSMEVMWAWACDLAASALLLVLPGAQPQGNGLSWEVTTCRVWYACVDLCSQKSAFQADALG